MSTAVTAEVKADGKELVIAIDGRFDFAAHQQFRDAYERVFPKPALYVIDLAKANYLDSSALGMLLLLRDHAGEKPGDVEPRVKIINASPDVRKILAISNFDKLFNIS
jgi:anti-anti-sigma factor